VIRITTLLLVMFLGSAWGATEKATVASYLKHDWYFTEIVIFRHRNIEPTEDLLHSEPRKFPLRLQSLEFDTSMDFQYPNLDLSAGLPPSLPGWMTLAKPPIALSESAAGPRPAKPTYRIAIPTELISPAFPTEMSLPETDLGGEHLQDVAREEFSRFEEKLTRKSLRWLSDGFSLLREVARMRRSSQFEVLHHGRWLQAVPERDIEAPFLLQLGERMPSGQHEIEGTLNVTLGRYLHVGANLWVQSEPLIQDDKAIESASLNERVDYAQLTEQRRMRSNETHYLDHPKIGLIVRIEPIEVPQALLDLVRAINEAEN